MTRQSPRRPYRKRRRAEGEAATRRRIVQATMELHRTVGPARTTVSAIAERAGVQRLTVYRHFPDEADLFAACGAAFVAADPPPDPATWATVGDPDRRLRAALCELYAYFGRNEAMLAHVERDAPLLPALAAEIDPRPFQEQARRVVLPRSRSKRARAALGHALSFSTWRSLVREQGLTDAQAVELMARLVEGCRRGREPRSGSAPAEGPRHAVVVQGGRGRDDLGTGTAP